MAATVPGWLQAGRGWGCVKQECTSREGCRNAQQPRRRDRPHHWLHLVEPVCPTAPAEVIATLPVAQ